MVGLNRVQLIGRLGRDPELNNVPNGKKFVCSVYMENNFKGESENREKHPE